MDDLRTRVTNGSEAAPEGEILPGQQIFLDIFDCSGKLRHDFKHGAFTDIAVRFTVLVHMHLVIAVLLRVGRVNAGPFQRLRVEQHGMSAAGLQEQRLIRTDFVQVRFGDVFVILDPPCGYVKLAFWVLRNEFFYDFTVFGIISQAGLHQVRLSDKTEAGQMTVAVGLQEAGIDKVFTVIQHLRVGAGQLFRFLCTADIGKYAVLHQRRLGKRPLLIHGDDVAENNRLSHGTTLLLFMVV